MLFLILMVNGGCVFSQDYTPDFDIPKFINSGGFSKEVYHKKNGKLILDEKYFYDKELNILRLTKRETLADGSILTGVNFFLDSKSRISKEEVYTIDPNIHNSNSVQILKYDYYDGFQTLSFYEKNNEVYMKKYFFYKNNQELKESFIISNNDLNLQEKNIYYKENGYEVNQKETYTYPRYRTIVKTKLDKNGFPIYVESKGEVIILDREEIPKQIIYYENDIDIKGNLSKISLIENKKKELIKEIINQYH